MKGKQSQLNPDIVLLNGEIYTLNELSPWAEAVAAYAGRIVYVGSNEIAKKIVKPETQIIDLNGDFTIPGFNDAHIHFHPKMLPKIRENGITTIQDITSPNSIDDYINLAEKNALTVRIFMRLPLDKWRDVPKHREKIEQFAGVLTLSGVKGYIDGRIRDHTALFFESYDNHPKSHGQLSEIAESLPEFEKLLENAISVNASISIHAIGDKGVHVLLDQYQRQIERQGLRNHRFRVIHACVVAPEDFKRFGELELIAEVNPYHCKALPWIKKKIGDDRSQRAFAFRTLKDNGALLCFGSDYPGLSDKDNFPLNPLLGIQAVVARPAQKEEIGTKNYFHDESLTLKEALEAYTVNPAYACFEEYQKGSLSRGKLADITVLSHNLFNIPLKEISKVKVRYTIVGGKVVYAAG